MIRLFLLLSTLALLTTACSREEQPAPQPTPTPPAAQEAPAAAPIAPGPIVTNDPEALSDMGARYYRRGCAQCHDEGVGGAPRLGDVEAWRPRLDKGLHKLVENAINGFQGESGLMPARGGNPQMRAEAVSMAVRFMAEVSRAEDEESAEDEWDEEDLGDEEGEEL